MSVRELAVDELNREKNGLSKCSSYPDSENIQVSKYLSHFQASQSCLLYRVRSRIVDVKEFHHYKYTENDRVCRACGDSIETLVHVLHECATLVNPVAAAGEKVCVRMQEFLDEVEELEEL